MNVSANATVGRPTDPAGRNAIEGFGPYYDRIDGRGCTGTTEQILEWAARKWGFDALGYPDLAKAMAVKETQWDQAFVGDAGCSTSILQIRMSNAERSGCGGWPDAAFARQSTPYAADYAMAIVRYHYDGSSWLRNGTKGSLRNAVGAYYCGCPREGDDEYATEVFGYLKTRPWQSPILPPLRR